MKPHLIHLKNRVSDSSADLNCLSHQYAVLFPHSSHLAVVVGSPMSVSPSRTVTSLSSLDDVLISSGATSFVFSYPHFRHLSVPSIGCIILLHFGQNSINIISCIVYHFPVVESQFWQFFGIEQSYICCISVRFRLSMTCREIAYGHSVPTRIA